MAERTTVVVCDDEEIFRWSICEHLESEGFATIPVDNGRKCLEAVQNRAPDCVVLDLRMPEMDGLTALHRIRESGSNVPVVVVTSSGGVDNAIDATRLGAGAYLTKPFDPREVKLAVDKVLTEDRLVREVHVLRDRQRSGYGDFIGRSPALREVFDTLSSLESVDAPTVLLLGESGSGKDVIARAIHDRGARRERIFMDIDCAALPEQLIESELFGHERGAFTDARTTKRGLFEVAAGGVAFLDEIGELSLGTQAKLLRALESRVFKRVGGVTNVKLDAAVIAATNRDLKTEVQAGRFREDLYYRLHVVPVRIPPLRDRKEDLPLLVGHFLEHFNRSFGRTVEGVSGAAMAMMEAYDWPGNVRELRNVLERIVILAKDRTEVQPDDLPAEVRFARLRPPTEEDACPFELPDEGVDLEAVERGLLIQALHKTGWNQSAASRLLGISRYALRYRMEKFKLQSA